MRPAACLLPARRAKFARIRLICLDEWNATDRTKCEVAKIMPNADRSRTAEERIGEVGIVMSTSPSQPELVSNTLNVAITTNDAIQRKHFYKQSIGQMRAQVISYISKATFQTKRQNVELIL